jgi:transcription factor WhiB
VAKPLPRIEQPVRVAPIRTWHPAGHCGKSENVKLEWFPADYVTRPDAEVAVVCARCPFAVECLNDALEFDETDGVRGGTTSYQRRQLLAERDRARCPNCGSDGVVPNGRGELCIACGTSWLV